MNRLTRRLAVYTNAILLPSVANLVSAEPFRWDSKRLKHSAMDIVVTETERHPCTSVLKIQMKTIGSSVGSSFVRLCSIRELAQQRGQSRYIAKVEDQYSRHHMLVEFLRTAMEPPELLDTRLIGQPVIDLQQFAPIGEKM